MRLAVCGFDLLRCQAYKPLTINGHGRQKLPAGICRQYQFFELRYAMENSMKEALQNCNLCPRHCGADRLAGAKGYCGQTAEIRAARAALHFWEEPCISGTNGSGTVFFTGCSLRCIFCQNRESALDGQAIQNGHVPAKSRHGKVITVDRLSEIFLELQEKGTHNINLVTPTHFIPQIRAALIAAKENGLSIPIVYNTGGYEEVESLRMLDGLIDIYLPDLKYRSTEAAARFSNAPDYFEKASLALQEMYRQVGDPIFEEATGLMKKGMIVRHLLLPGQVGESKRVLRYLHETFGNHVYVSIMNQYTPMPQLIENPAFEDIARKVTDEEYQRLLDFAEAIGIELGFCQEGETAKESFIPPFSCEGL